MLDPPNTRGTKTAYSEFRKFLVSDGYIRIGVELYMRVVVNRNGAEKHLKRLEKYNPGTGTIRVFKMTEKQFSSMTFLTGTPNQQEQIVGANCHIVL